VFRSVQSTVTAILCTLNIEQVYYTAMASWQRFNRSRVSNCSRDSSTSREQK